MTPTHDPGVSLWTEFWHRPLRAERLAGMRICLAVALLADQLFQLLPNLMEFFGPTGVAPAGLHDAYQLRRWAWTVAFFNHDDPAVLYPFFWCWVGVTALWGLGVLTRWTNVLVWLGTMCWVSRNPNILNGGDDTLQVGIFLLMLSPSGKALSFDSWLGRRVGGGLAPAYVPPWSVRVLQIQLCLIYLTTGLAKLGGDGEMGTRVGLFGVEFPWPKGTWWDGSAVHYVLNYTTMSRWSFAQLPLPQWFTAILSFTSVWWEILFTPLVMHRWTRAPALWFGILFHLGIYLTIEVGWFSFYTMSFYPVWIPEWYWARWDGRRGLVADGSAGVA